MELAVPAFIAGLFTFLAPCTLPLVPGYLGFISGTSIEDFMRPETARRARFRVILNGAFFTIGFSLVFIAFGTLAGFLGATLAAYRVWLTRIGGVFVIIFGLFMIDALKIPFLARERHIAIPHIFQRGKPHNSLVLGAAFGFGWTPCVGPVLGSIITLAASSATVATGATLLAIYSAGLAIPFLAIAIGYGSAAEHITRISKFLRPMSIIGGIFLVLVGALLLTDQFALFISYGFRVFDFLGLGSFDNILFRFL